MADNNITLIYQILHILKKHSSPDSPLKVSDIERIFPRETNAVKAPTPKTIRRHVTDLVELSESGLLDGKVECEERAGAAWYHYAPLMTKEETQLLCDAVASSKFIDKDASWRLIRKLGAPYPREFSARYRPIVALKRDDRKMYNAAFFESVRVLTEAIERRRKAKFRYLKYDMKKKLVPRIKENDGYSIVSPYDLIWTLDHYYLYCKIEPAGKDRFLRVDKIRDACVLEEPIDAPDMDGTQTMTEYARSQAFMFGGKMEYITLKCQMRMLDQVIDFFGEAAKLKPIDEHHFEVEVRTSLDNIKYWVLQYSTAIDEIRPERLRNIIVDYLEDGLKRLRG